MHKIILFAIITIILASNALATTYYVSNTEGKDANNGLSENSSIKTLSEINYLTIKSGDTILLKCGNIWTEKWNYQTGGNGIENNPITFDRYGTCNGENNPIISGGIGIDQQGFTIFLANKRYININNLEFDNAKNNGVQVYQSSYVTFNNCYFKNNYNWALSIDSSKNIIIKNSLFNNNGIKMLEANTGGETIWIANSDNIELIGNEVIHSGGVGINLWHSKNIDLQNNKVTDCTAPNGEYEAGIYFDGCQDSTAKNNYVKGCHLGYSVNSEITGYTSNRITFDHNIGYNNKINMITDNNIGGTANFDIKITSNTFIKDIPADNGAYGIDIILDGTNNLLFKDNLIADFDKGKLLENTNTQNNDFSNNLWYSSIGKYPTITQNNEQNTNPLLHDLTNFIPSGIACIASSTGSYVGAVSCEENTNQEITPIQETNPKEPTPIIEKVLSEPLNQDLDPPPEDKLGIQNNDLAPQHSYLSQNNDPQMTDYTAEDVAPSFIDTLTKIIVGTGSIAIVMVIFGLLGLAGFLLHKIR